MNCIIFESVSRIVIFHHFHRCMTRSVNDGDKIFVVIQSHLDKRLPISRRELGFFNRIFRDNIREKFVRLNDYCLIYRTQVSIPLELKHRVLIDLCDLRWATMLRRANDEDQKRNVTLYVSQTLTSRIYVRSMD